jgi:hypothetical protein
MSKATSDSDMEDELKPDYDLSALLKGGKRGKYADRFRQGTNLVLLDPDVASVFHSDQAVNRALRLAIQIAKIQEQATQNTGNAP